MPLVETPAAPNGSSVLCRAPSCVEDPQAGALEALEAQDLRLLSDLLADFPAELPMQFILKRIREKFDTAEDQ